MTQSILPDDHGQRLLALLVSLLPGVNAKNPRTYISYKEAHDRLKLQQVRETWGESLKAQGLVSLAEWTQKTGRPAITGLVIDRTSLMPGKGYFDLFGKRQDDFSWWVSEVDRSKAFDWSPYLPLPIPPAPPTAVDIATPTERQETTTNRIIRDTVLSRRIKELHKYECQLCGHTISLGNGTRYAEAHHIQPLGAPHNGPDSADNLICLCPNHHAELDFGVRALVAADLRSVPGHTVGEVFIFYHNAHVYKEAS